MCVENGKSCSSNLSQLSSYHPYGMLDRDQRTTRSITSQLQRCDWSAVDECSTNPKSIPNRCPFERFNRNVNCKPNCLHSSDIARSNETCQKSVLSSCSCSRKDLSRTTKEPAQAPVFSNYKRSRLSRFLISVCFWVLIMHSVGALPSKMSGDQHQSNLKCANVKGVIEKILQQSNLSYEINYSRLDNYTQAVFSDNHKNHHNMWRRKHLNWIFPNGEPLKLDDYDKLPPQEAVSHLYKSGEPSDEEMKLEMINLYQRLKILSIVFEKIRKDHEDNMHEIVDAADPNHHTHILEFFKQQYNYVHALLRETREGMRALGIKEPSIPNTIPEYSGTRELRDWIVTREHLKLLNYVLKAYEILLHRCT